MIVTNTIDFVIYLYMSHLMHILILLGLSIDNDRPLFGSNDWDVYYSQVNIYMLSD